MLDEVTSREPRKLTCESDTSQFEVSDFPQWKRKWEDEKQEIQMAESSALVVVQVLGMTFGLEDNMLTGQAQVQIIRCAISGFVFLCV